MPSEYKRDLLGYMGVSYCYVCVNIIHSIFYWFLKILLQNVDFMSNKNTKLMQHCIKCTQVDKCTQVEIYLHLHCTYPAQIWQDIMFTVQVLLECCPIATNLWYFFSELLFVASDKNVIFISKRHTLIILQHELNIFIQTEKKYNANFSFTLLVIKKLHSLVDVYLVNVFPSMRCSPVIDVGENLEKRTVLSCGTGAVFIKRLR